MSTIDIDNPKHTVIEELNFPRVGDIIEWVNLLEVWAHDKWVDEGGPYFGISRWEEKMVKMGLVIEESVVEDMWHWTVWCWKDAQFYHISSTTDKTRIVSRAPIEEKNDTLLSFYQRKNKITL
jgi:hypothetical protein